MITPNKKDMEAAQQNLHAMKLTDLREKLKAADLINTSLKATYELQVKDLEARLATAQKAAEEHVKVVRMAVDEERKKARRDTTKMDKTIKALEKQLQEEKEANAQNKSSSIDYKKALTEMEGKYKFEKSVYTEQQEQERALLEERMTQMAEEHKQMIENMNAEWEKRLRREVAQREKLKATLTQQHAAEAKQNNEKTTHLTRTITQLKTELEDAKNHTTSLQQEISNLQQALKQQLVENDTLRDAYDSQCEITRQKEEEIKEKEQAHQDELDQLFVRIKQTIQKKDKIIQTLKGELASVHNRLL